MKLFKLSETDKKDLATTGKIIGVFLVGMAGVIVIFSSLFVMLSSGFAEGALITLLGIALVGGSYWYYDLEVRDDNDELEARRKREKLDRIDKLVSEIEILDAERRELSRVIEENKKAIFGEKAKLRKQALKRVREIESEIGRKQEEAKRIKENI